MVNMNIQTRQITRYTLGVMLAIALAYGLNWSLAYVMPVFVAKIFVDKPKPTRGTIIELLLSMVATVIIALGVSNGIAQYPVILLLLVGLLMFWAYYLFQDPKWNFFATIMIIATLLVPYLGVITPAAALGLGKGLMVSGVGAVAIFWLMHTLLPDSDDQASGSEEQGLVLSDELRQTRMFEAGRALMISFPVITYFYFFQPHGALLTMAFIGILSLQLTQLTSIKLSIFLILTNSIGGVMAIVAYELLVTVPWFPFLMAMMTLVILVFAQKLYQEPAKAAIFASILSAMLVLFGAAIASDNKEIDMNVYTRLWQIVLAAIYMVSVATLIESRKPKAVLSDASAV
ncbi:DUF2955 domain-containing protein [Photobacterium sanctipauli]|uniref:DUF2955 domain-containing protein n=1 Tax=Photobacterium sanctipauli TaxID=1342794 RepID=A0A2T3NN22_9GAMM|nr:DUF2955 domain-containing protein [Photobacterium sanctipauli]PSW16914.1 DUF2955 domain-containing protein [Photobacterium sanctipauli]